MNPRRCDDCGSDPYFSREFPRVRDEAFYWRNKAKALAAELEALKLDREFDTYRDRTDVAWLQGKVVAQARELKRLNDARNAQRIRAGLEPQPDKEMTSLTVVESKAPAEKLDILYE
jgi:hypothetical protein